MTFGTSLFNYTHKQFRNMGYMSVLDLLSSFPKITLNEQLSDPPGDHIPLTSIKIRANSEGKVFGVYQIPDMWSNFTPKDAISYLESVPIDLSNPEDQRFRIQRIYHAADKTNPSLFEPETIALYFQDIPTGFPEGKGSIFDFELYKQAEQVLVSSLCELLNYSVCEFLPIPQYIENSKELDSIKYLLFDRSKLSLDSISIIDELPGKLGDLV